MRLFSWQIVHGEELEHLGKSQQKISKNVLSLRGAILASDGTPLVSSSPGWTIWADPRKITDPKSLSEKLAPYLVEKPLEIVKDLDEASPDEKPTPEELLEIEEGKLFNILTRRGAWVSLKQKIDNKTKEVIEKLNLEGLGFDPNQRRIYQEASMSAHLLGFVGQESSGLDQGYFGLEGKYDVALSGVGGEKYFEKDALGNPILAGDGRIVAALDGVDLKTHIDRTIQYFVEKRLAEGVKKYGAKAGSIVIMRPYDGAILAMSSYPTYISTHFSYFKEEDFINPVISQTFEPGSVFKPIVMASALDAEAVKTDDLCDKCTGSLKIGPYTIRTWDEQYHPDSTPGEIIKNSDNTGMVWAAERLGQDKLYDYLSKFGLGAVTGIDLQGETASKLRQKGKWGFIDLATTSFGQGIAITPIQLVRAIAAIANDGKLPTPQVVDKIIGSGFEQDIKPEAHIEVISKKAADQITEMMINATKTGEAKWAAPKGHVIAGKTGTAQIPIQGHYDPEKTIASFIGFAPATNPEFIMLVTLREPQSSPWASETAAPLWFDIAKDLFVYLGIPPTQ
ncbi:MAG: penicillin-binding protein 2 [Patescibacteria group bacterium]